MKQIQALIIILLTIPVYNAAAQESVFPKGNKAPNVHHTGDIWLTHIRDANENFDHNVVQAVSAAGSKLDWHFHPKGQQLIITHGTGYYQERGKEVQVVRKGDEIYCLPNVEHWHGATPSSSVTYIAISGNAKTQWLEPVPESTYTNIDSEAILQKSIENEIRQLSKIKWQWMADKDVEKLEALFHKEAQYVHMGGSWGTEQELAIIKSGGIWYKKADIHEVSLDVIEDTAVLLNNITLLAEVGGREVSNPFIVTEVYKKINGSWKLLNLSFVKQMVRE